MLSILRICFIIFILLLTASCAPKYMHRTETLLPPKEDMALVRFMFPRSGGKIFDGEKFLADILATTQISGLQFDYYAEPGKHVFVTTRNTSRSGGGGSFLEADLEAGKTYYIIMKVYYPGILPTPFFSFLAVTRGSKYWDYVKEYEKTLRKYELDHNALKKGDKKNKRQIRKILSQYKTELKNKHDWPKLSPEDGI